MRKSVLKSRTAERSIQHVPAVLWNATRYLRPIANTYVGAAGLEQRWGMFWDPPSVDV